MEFVIELLLDLIIEGSIEVGKNKKVSKWIRYPLISLVILFYSVIIFGLIICGIFLGKDNLFIGLFFIAIGLFFLIASIIKFINTYKEKKGNKNCN